MGQRVCALMKGSFFSWRWIITAFRSPFSQGLHNYLGVWRKRSWELGCCLRHRQIPLYREMASFCVKFVSRLFRDIQLNVSHGLIPLRSGYRNCVWTSRAERSGNPSLVDPLRWMRY